MPFEDDDKKIIRKTGLKINNQSSSVQTPKNSDRSVAFEQKATNANERIEGYRQKIFELSSKFTNIVKDGVLPENKSPIAKSLEQETLINLINLGKELNVDELQPEGEGSMALCMIMLKCMLIQRDTINKLSFKLSELDKKVTSSKKELQLNEETK